MLPFKGALNQLVRHTSPSIGSQQRSYGEYPEGQPPYHISLSQILAILSVPPAQNSLPLNFLALITFVNCNIYTHQMSAPCCDWQWRPTQCQADHLHDYNQYWLLVFHYPIKTGQNLGSYWSPHWPHSYVTFAPSACFWIPSFSQFLE